jgi:hypothetical protein
MTHQSLAMRRLQSQSDRERVKDYLGGRTATTHEIRTALGMAGPYLNSLLRTLKAQGVAVSYEGAVWALTGQAPHRQERRRSGVIATADGVPRVIQLPARQLGIARDPLTAALFGPAA